MLRRHLLATLAAAPLAFASVNFAAAQAAPEVMLFNVVTVKDSVIVGWTKAEIAAMGKAEPVAQVSAELQRAGQLTVWQYASQKDKDGSLKMMPLRRIAIFSSGTARIEPYKAAVPVMPPSS